MSTADWRALDLSADGRSLVEASAGTGKTWTIAALYLRLLLEPCDGGAIGPRNIVVSTFTDAAAQELRQRIRARLQGAQALLADARRAPAERLVRDVQDDEVLQWLRARCLAVDGSVDADKVEAFHLRLQLALAELDQAPIGTLHALCHRILREQPFASGTGFGQLELVAGSALDGELADDLWRRLADAAVPPDACLVNFYRGDARMGLHQDRDEADFSVPVLSVSLGDTAVFRLGGPRRGDPTRSLRLSSGDVCVLGGPARLAFHGIDRVIPGSSRLIPGGGRINLTLRRARPRD